MKKIFIIILAFVANNYCFAQDDLFSTMLNDSNNSKPTPVYATFKSTRLITGQSTENISPKHLNVVILHRFGLVKNGEDLYYNFLGFDNASIRFAFDYGITNNLMVGIGRSVIGKTYDGSIKYKILKQKKGSGTMPISLSYYGNMSINTSEWEDKMRDNYFSSRLQFCNSFLISRKFNEHLSLQITPTFIHRNLVKFAENDLYVLGVGGSIKITRSTRLNFEYYPRLNGRNEQNQFDCLSVGFDIETGGHVFQLMLTNSVGMIEQTMITQTNISWPNQGLRLGFNLSRKFSFDRGNKSK